MTKYIYLCMNFYYFRKKEGIEKNKKTKSRIILGFNVRFLLLKLKLNLLLCN